MKNGVNSQIATVHLGARIWQTVVAVLGVTFGVSMYIFMNSFINGVNDAQDDLAFSALAHVRIYNEDQKRSFDPATSLLAPTDLLFLRSKKQLQTQEGIKNSGDIMRLVLAHSEVKAVCCQLNFSVFFRNGSKQVNGVINGVEPEAEDKLFGSGDKMAEGSWFGLMHQKSGIVLGKVLAENLNVKSGDQVNVLTADGIARNFEVIGIISTSVKEIDRSRAYIHIAAARQLQNKNYDFASDILINLKDKEKSGRFADAISPAVGYQIETWQVANQQLVAASGLRSIIALAVSLTILLVAGFGIYNIMNMTINEKIKEIAILKAMGFSGGDIRTIFLLQAGAIGIGGGITGVALGYVISSLVNQVPFNIAGLSTLPITFRSQDFIFALVFGVATTLIAGYLPARKASNIDPVIIIRG